jgi:hypothetical protein
MAKAIHPAPVRSNIPLSQPPRRVATPIGCDSIATGGSVQHVFSPPARNYHLRHIAPPGPRRQAKNALSYVPDTIMWLNAATPGLFRHLVHHSGNITGWFWHGDLPLSLGGCHAGETFTRVPPPSIASVSPGSPRQSSNTSGWMAERCYTHRSVSCRIPIVMNFGEFANAHGGQRSARSRPFVRAWVCKHIRGREQLANAVRNPLRQMLQLTVPGYIGRARPHKPDNPFERQAPGLLMYLTEERGLRRRCACAK